MKKVKKLKGAEALGIKIKVSKSFGKHAGEVWTSKKLKIANEVVSKLKMD